RPRSLVTSGRAAPLACAPRRTMSRHDPQSLTPKNAPQSGTLQLLPCPTPAPQGSTASGAVTRHVFCPHYPQCLDVAVREDWEDWTCSRCPLARAQPATSAAALATRQPT